MHNRLQERAELKRRLKNGASIQMFAPRRIGKTWILQRLEQDLKSDGWLVIYIDLQGRLTEDDLLSELCRKLELSSSLTDRAKTHFYQRFSSLLHRGPGQTPLETIGTVDSGEFAEALISALNEQKRDTAILIDEIALFVMELIHEDPRRAHSFLYRLRRLQQENPHVRWVFTGSIGLDVVAQRSNLLGALTDLQTFILEPFNVNQARSYVRHMTTEAEFKHRFDLSDADFGYLAEEIGWLAPYYLWLVADRIEPTGEKDGEKFAIREDINRAIEKLLRPQERGCFATWVEHVDKNFPKDESRLLHAILEVCCEHPSGEKTATIRDRLAARNIIPLPRILKEQLIALHNGGLLVEDNDRWQFRSGLVRRYWLKYLHE